MNISTAWRALSSGRLLRGWWPWRSVAYVAGGALAGFAAFIAITALLTLGVTLAVVLIGIPLLIAAALSGIPVGIVERLRLRLVDTRPAHDPHREPPRPGLASWARTRLTEQSTWRALGYTLLHATLLWPLDLLVLGFALVAPGSLLIAPAALALAEDGEVKLVKLWLIDDWREALLAVPVGLAGLVAGLYLVTLYAAGRGALARVLLSVPAEDARERLTAVTRSRARLVAAFDAERRRIERDLHDGAQQRLLALSMTLGLAKYAEGQDLQDLLDRARAESTTALAEIRELIHGIHPQVLVDRGLGPALEEALDHLGIPVESDISLPEERPPSAVETAAYFAAREVFTNVARHSGATNMRLSVEADTSWLRLEIIDDGHGGADPAEGTGLTGLADRIAVVDGTLSLSSPPGGPTRVHVEIPWHRSERPASSSPKTES
ncbi:sensor histidine kinase [Phytomonospora endophytica]|uniref:histidine kinase n=1 Tax=Phytomonospora endophytica TaxID=714109 RepID=A0A841FQA8_9ACTN|nr:sensor histidine kinase [Phytomonospora endophytica]MBB6039481.1 signal transduction histidine kinase [Phytomonospora endophytica]GIG70208.1 histidine kinase [Phytomonospora endophytica]